LVVRKHIPGQVKSSQTPVPSERTVRNLDLTDVVRRTKSMLLPQVRLDWNSYTFDCTFLAGKALLEVATDAKKGPAKTEWLRMAPLNDDSGDVAGIPTAQQGPSTVEVTWPKKGLSARIDAQKYLLKYPIEIPHGHRAYFPVSQETIAGEGPALIFHLSQVQLAEIRVGSKRKSSGTNSGANEATPAAKPGAPTMPASPPVDPAASK